MWSQVYRDLVYRVWIQGGGYRVVDTDKRCGYRVVDTGWWIQGGGYRQKVWIQGVDTGWWIQGGGYRVVDTDKMCGYRVVDTDKRCGYRVWIQGMDTGWWLWWSWCEASVWSIQCPRGCTTGPPYNKTQLRHCRDTGKLRIQHTHTHTKTWQGKARHDKASAQNAPTKQFRHAEFWAPWLPPKSNILIRHRVHTPSAGWGVFFHGA